MTIRDLIPDVLEKYDSAEEFFDYEHNPELRALKQSARHVLGVADDFLWGALIELLRDDRRWKKLASKPQDLDRDLNRIFAIVRKEIKHKCGIPDHRPARQEPRDAEIWQMRRSHPDMTFGQIGIRFGMKAPAVQRAFTRQTDREKKRLRRRLELLAELQEKGAFSVGQ
jgi:hypothetical protein